MEENPDFGLVGSNFIKVYSNNEKEYTQKDLTDDKLRIALTKGSCIQHSTVMFRKDILDAIGGYNTGIKFLFDRDIYLRVAQKSKLANLSEHLVEIGRHDYQFFNSTYKGIERQLFTIKYNFLAISKLNLSKNLYVSTFFRSLYQVLNLYLPLEKTVHRWKKLRT